MYYFIQLFSSSVKIGGKLLMLCCERKTIRIMYSKGILIDIRIYLIEISINARPTVSEHLNNILFGTRSTCIQQLVDTLPSVNWPICIDWHLIACLHSINTHSTVGWCWAKCWLPHMYWLTLDSMSAKSSWLSPNCQLRSGSMIVDWVLTKVSIENQESLEGQSRASISQLLNVTWCFNELTIIHQLKVKLLVLMVVFCSSATGQNTNFVFFFLLGYFVAVLRNIDEFLCTQSLSIP